MSATAPDFTAATWRKSTYSDGNGGACVEVADGFTGIIPVRDSKVTDGPAVVFGDAAWTSFVSTL
ncbi:DUF397 domain-containing protein [Streptomyces sp. NPDC048211]|uniref:DUF397 domain-containing protein n=1 Tax=Streptomyces sp. NPDC048211 TaxID=3365516 RepID=UPI0037155FD5